MPELCRYTKITEAGVHVCSHPDANAQAIVPAPAHGGPCVNIHYDTSTPTPVCRLAEHLARLLKIDAAQAQTGCPVYETSSSSQAI